MSQPPDRNVILYRIIFFLAATLSAILPSKSKAQYAWDAHLGPQQTGFEKRWFGNWEMEMVPLLGMIDRGHYTEVFAGTGVRRVTRTVRRVDRGDGSERIVHKSFSLVDVDGRITATVYQNPQTGKQVQRESFRYDDNGNLVEWRPLRDPDEIPFASIAATTYPGRLPFGRFQNFRYHDNGMIAEWRACMPGRDRRSRGGCEFAYVQFDERGLVVEFVWLGDVFEIQRDDDGNVATVRRSAKKASESWEMNLRYDYIVIREQYVMRDSSVVENIVARDSRGRVVQYQIASPDTPEYYSTVTWEYDAGGVLKSITRGLDSFAFEHDGAGRIVRVRQSVLPNLIERSYNDDARLKTQSPPFAYNRFDLVDEGVETFTYGPDGLLSTITVHSGEGVKLGFVTFEYDFHGRASLDP